MVYSNDALRRLFQEWQTQAKAEVAAYLQTYAGKRPSPAAVARDCPSALGRRDLAAWLMAALAEVAGDD